MDGVWKRKRKMCATARACVFFCYIFVFGFDCRNPSPGACEFERRVLICNVDAGDSVAANGDVGDVEYGCTDAGECSAVGEPRLRPVADGDRRWPLVGVAGAGDDAVHAFASNRFRCTELVGVKLDPVAGRLTRLVARSGCGAEDGAEEESLESSNDDEDGEYTPKLGFDTLLRPRTPTSELALDGVLTFDALDMLRV